MAVRGGRVPEGPDPNDRAASKRTWEKAMKEWRVELKRLVNTATPPGVLLMHWSNLVVQGTGRQRMYLDVQARTNLRGDWRAWLISDRRPHADPARDSARDPEHGLVVQDMKFDRWNRSLQRAPWRQ